MVNLPTIDMTGTGQNINRLRKQAGLSVKDLQDIFGFATPQAIYKWQQDFDWLVNLPKEKVLNKSNNAEIVFEEQDFDGFLSKLKEYSNIECLGEVIEHSWGQRVIRFYDLDGHINHGLQSEVESYDEVLIPSKEGIIAYLSSGKIKGIGPKVAERIYAAFGLRTLDVLDKEPERLLSISGIGEDKLRKICDSYPENRGARLVYSSPLFHIFS